MNAIVRSSLAAIALAVSLSPVAAFAQSTPDAMHGDAMKGDSMHGMMTKALANAKADLATQKAMLAMMKSTPVMMKADAKMISYAEKRAKDDADYIKLITIAMQAEHVGP